MKDKTDIINDPKFCKLPNYTIFRKRSNTINLNAQIIINWQVYVKNSNLYIKGVCEGKNIDEMIYHVKDCFTVYCTKNLYRLEGKMMTTEDETLNKKFMYGIDADWESFAENYNKINTKTNNNVISKMEKGNRREMYESGQTKAKNKDFENDYISQMFGNKLKDEILLNEKEIKLLDETTLESNYLMNAISMKVGNETKKVKENDAKQININNIDRATKQTNEFVNKNLQQNASEKEITTIFDTNKFNVKLADVNANCVIIEDNENPQTFEIPKPKLFYKKKTSIKNAYDSFVKKKCTTKEKITVADFINKNTIFSAEKGNEIIENINNKNTNNEYCNTIKNESIENTNDECEQKNVYEETKLSSNNNSKAEEKEMSTMIASEKVQENKNIDAEAKKYSPKQEDFRQTEKNENTKKYACNVSDFLKSSLNFSKDVIDLKSEYEKYVYENEQRNNTNEGKNVDQVLEQRNNISDGKNVDQILEQRNNICDSENVEQNVDQILEQRNNISDSENVDQNMDQGDNICDIKIEKQNVDQERNKNRLSINNSTTNMLIEDCTVGDKTYTKQKDDGINKPENKEAYLKVDTYKEPTNLFYDEQKKQVKNSVATDKSKEYNQTDHNNKNRTTDNFNLFNTSANNGTICENSEAFNVSFFGPETTKNENNSPKNEKKLNLTKTEIDALISSSLCFNGSDLVKEMSQDINEVVLKDSDSINSDYESVKKTKNAKSHEENVHKTTEYYSKQDKNINTTDEYTNENVNQPTDCYDKQDKKIYETSTYIIENKNQNGDLNGKQDECNAQAVDKKNDDINNVKDSTLCGILNVNNLKNETTKNYTFAKDTNQNNFLQSLLHSNEGTVIKSEKNNIAVHTKKVNNIFDNISESDYLEDLSKENKVTKTGKSNNKNTVTTKKDKIEFRNPIKHNEYAQKKQKNTNKMLTKIYSKNKINVSDYYRSMNVDKERRKSEIAYINNDNESNSKEYKKESAKRRKSENNKEEMYKADKVSIDDINNKRSNEKRNANIDCNQIKDESEKTQKNEMKSSLEKLFGVYVNAKLEDECDKKESCNNESQNTNKSKESTSKSTNESTVSKRNSVKKKRTSFTMPKNFKIKEIKASPKKISISGRKITKPE